MVPVMPQDPVKIIYYKLCVFSNVYKHSITAFTKKITHIKTADVVQLWVQSAGLGHVYGCNYYVHFQFIYSVIFFNESALGLDIEPL